MFNPSQMLSTDESRNVSDVHKITILFETIKSSTRWNFTRFWGGNMIKYDRFTPIQRSRINFSNTAEKRVYEMQVIDIYEKKKKKKEEIAVAYLVQNFEVLLPISFKWDNNCSNSKSCNIIT